VPDDFTRVDEGHTSVESDHGPEHRPTPQTLAEPTRRRQAVHEPSRSMSRRDTRSSTRASRATHTSRRFTSTAADMALSKPCLTWSRGTFFIQGS
jgi:hypothetical protein